MDSIRRQFRCPVTNIAVDNAAKVVMASVCTSYLAARPDEPKILQTRDPAHCIDLLPKDCVKVMNDDSPYGFGQLCKDTQVLLNLLTTDRVAGIIQDGKRTLLLPRDMPKATSYSDTRMNKAATMFKTIQGNKPFFDNARTLPSFMVYYNASTPSRKAVIDNQLELATSLYFERVVIAIKWFKAFEDGYNIVSSNRTPMSAYLPTVQAMRNELNSALANEGGRDYFTLFGEASELELTDFIRTRFNMDGVDPEGRRVGLLDPYQLWAYMVDPFRKILAHPVVFMPSPHYHINAMLDFFSAGVTPEEQRPLKLALNQYLSRQGFWMDMFRDEITGPVLSQEAVVNAQEQLTLQDVRNWIEITGGHESRLEFFQMVPDNLCHKMILTTLMSMRTTGSIAVERIAKPFKVNVLSKKRNRLLTSNAELLLRVGLNLRFLLDHRKESKAALVVGNGWTNVKKAPPTSAQNEAALELELEEESDREDKEEFSEEEEFDEEAFGSD